MTTQWCSTGRLFTAYLYQFCLVIVHISEYLKRFNMLIPKMILLYTSFSTMHSVVRIQRMRAFWGLKRLP